MTKSQDENHSSSCEIEKKELSGLRTKHLICELEQLSLLGKILEISSKLESLLEG